MRSLHRPLRLLTTAALLAGGLTAVVASAATADADPALPDNCAPQSAGWLACSYVYDASGSHEQTFKVPAGVSTVHVDAIGAKGADYSVDTGPYGGHGADVAGDLTGLTSGQTLYVEVGGAGQLGAGGFNGGGESLSGLGGGGASDVRTTSISSVSDANLTPTNDSRLIVAGGGGGAGSTGADCPGGTGGDAGAAGAPGGADCADSGAGGAAGPPASTPVTGGVLPAPLGEADLVGGGGAGGGGGGYYAGGSGVPANTVSAGSDGKFGGGGGGGGGSSLVPTQNATGPTLTTAQASVTISYQVSYQLHTTPLLGSTSIPRIPRNGLPASSMCPAGSFTVGARVWTDTLVRVTGVAALCSTGKGSPTVGAVLGDKSDAATSADSLCSSNDRAIGLEEANGEVTNAVGVRCSGLGGTYDADVIGKPYVNNASTTRHSADCAGITGLTGITGWYNLYGGIHNNVYGVQGICKTRTSTVLIVAAPEASAVVGQQVTVYYSVVADAGTPTGTVAVSGANTTGCSAPASTEMCTLTFTAPGPTTLTATYVDDVDFLGSSSTALPYTVYKAPTETVITASLPDPSRAGQAVTVHYSVTSNGGTPTGDVTVTGTNTTGCTGKVADGLCQLTFSASGPSSLTATYGGDDNFLTSSGMGGHTVLADQTISVTSEVPSPAYPTQTYTPTATAPGGDVSVSVDSSTSAYGTPSVACTVADGTATFHHSGSCVLDFDQAGNGTIAPAPQMQQTIAVSPMTVAAVVNLTPASLVFGQDASISATAKISAGPPALIGTPVASGSVQFSVGDRVFGPVAVDENGQASWPSLLVGGRLSAGQYDRTSRYYPAEGSDYAADNHKGSLTIGQASSSTALHVGATSVSGKVTAVAPGTGTPTGSVTFSLDGKSIGTATLVNGTATLAHTVPAGKAGQVAAQYSGDDDFTASSVSTAQQDPTITAKVTSSVAKSRFGWYRTPVTVSFTCTPHGAPLTTACPKPVTLTKDGANQAVTRTIAASDGGMATVTVRVNLDRTAPSVKVTGVRNGAIYTATAPKAGCSASDRLSGVASCKVTSSTKVVSGARRITYTATAVDKAGNSRKASVTVTVSSFGFLDATYSGGAWTVKRGHTYTLAGLTSGTRPRYVDAAPFNQKPRGLDHFFHAAGHVGSAKRWVLGVTMQQALRSHRYWNVGVLVGKTLYVIKIRVL